MPTCTSLYVQGCQRSCRPICWPIFTASRSSKACRFYRCGLSRQSIQYRQGDLYRGAALAGNQACTGEPACTCRLAAHAGVQACTCGRACRDLYSRAGPYRLKVLLLQSVIVKIESLRIKESHKNLLNFKHRYRHRLLWPITDCSGCPNNRPDYEKLPINWWSSKLSISIQWVFKRTNWSTNWEVIVCPKNARVSMVSGPYGEFRMAL